MAKKEMEPMRIKNIKPQPRVIHPSLINIYAEINAAKITAQLAKNKVYELEAQFKDQVEKLITIPDGNRLTLGNWDCPTSPTGSCIYDATEDPCLDDCLFCHDPDERK
jgi:hypothetical protein